MSDAPRRAIAWFRRDLRVHDNRMLADATADAGQVFPVFVSDPAVLAAHRRAAGRVAWFGASLVALDGRLRRAGSGLTVLSGRPEAVLRDFAARVGADAVYAGLDEEPAARQRDDAVGRAVDLRIVQDQRLLPADALRTGSGEPYRVFTPFRRALDARLRDERGSLTAEALPDLARLAPMPASAGDPFPFREAPHGLPAAGEDAASRRLHAFKSDDLWRYATERDRPDLDTTSGISPYLRTGALSVRAAWRTALATEDEAAESGDRDAAAGARRWRDELAWREFYASVLLTHPDVTRSVRPEFDEIAWEEGPGADAALQAWREGCTGYPMVDAGMRQLAASGWMHNRMRLITASFLVKDLGIDWRRGEAVFMEHLLDGDMAQNNGNWQWVAGVGTDAAPYFRVFNPVAQGKRFDPDGAFVRRWVPELAALPGADIHEPWKAPVRERPRDYPEPIVEHGMARHRALQRYRAARMT